MVRWKKSSRSGSVSDCVEVRSDRAAVRDSKHPSSQLTLPRTALLELLAQIKR
jgi:hypothetical protein